MIPLVVLCLTCFISGKIAQTTAQKLSSVYQEKGFLSVETADNVTLHCLHGSSVPARLYWYKQTLGQKPRLISTSSKYDTNWSFYGEFKNDPRFTLDTANGKNDLKITDLRISDSATYNCLSGYVNNIVILKSTTVIVTTSGLNAQTLVHQSKSNIIQQGGSVTLNCTVHTGTCDGEHSVYWFKSSEESHPGLIYTHGGRNDQCERKPDTQTHTCVYNLQMMNVDLSHAGTYYCAVASCGHILFGNGTKLGFGNEVALLELKYLVYFLSGALAFATILLVLLAFSVYKMSKRNRFQSPESEARFSAPPSAYVEGNRDEDNLHYAALSINLHNEPRRQRNNTVDECVYSSVKQ